jgi:cytochrome b561
MVFVLLVVFGGFFLKSIMSEMKWKTGLMLKMKLFHKIFGYILLAIAQINIILGIIRYS